MRYKLRLSRLEDIDKLMEIYSNAQDFMIKNGNPDQWGKEWPSKEKIEEDIKYKISYEVIENDSIIAVFAFIVGVDKTYLEIKEGSWLTNKEYGTIHRLASSFDKKGVFEFIQNELENKYGCNFRIDTHQNNKIMIKLVEKLGYKYCGLITPIEGGVRVAYEKDRK